MKEKAIIKICPVISVFDDADGDRIKVRVTPEDNGTLDEDLPYVFPLLPKMLHVKPQIEELVLVIFTNAGDGHSIRYYIGPIISQPQYINGDKGCINATSLYPAAFKEPDVALSTNDDSKGAFANNNDIAIYGRGKSDILLTEDDVRVRCGSRVKDTSKNNSIIFNKNDSAYIHLKHTDEKRGNETDQYRSTATIVADKINLLGNHATERYETNNKNMIANDVMQNIIEKAHQLPYGDILVEFLQMFREAFMNHTHPYPGDPVCQDDRVVKLNAYDLNKMLSDSVRIN